MVIIISVQQSLVVKVVEPRRTWKPISNDGLRSNSVKSKLFKIINSNLMSQFFIFIIHEHLKLVTHDCGLKEVFLKAHST